MDEIELKLPVSGKTVVIRNYTTRKDDEMSQAILYAGVTATSKTAAKVDSQSVEFPLTNVVSSEQVYVSRLVQSIDGSRNVPHELESLRSLDYAAIEEAVSKIVEENSPKAKAGKKNSSDATPAK